MTQRVPRWDLEENCHDSARLSFHADSSSAFDNEVAELTWENGQLAMHGLVTPKPPPATPTPSKYSWEKPRASGTLECIVDQATSLPPPKGDELVLWFEHHLRSTAKDALVPCSVSTHSARAASTKVGSCSGSAARREASPEARKRTRIAGEWSSGDPSLSLSASASRHVTMDTCEVDANVSLGSHEQTSLGKPLSSRTKTTSVDEHDSCYTKPQREEESGDEEKRKRGRSSVSRKRSKAAATHNQSERKRRDRINQKMKTLQRLVPNSSKTDKASMLDEVIEYLKQLQAQVQMMSKMSSIPQLMAMQQLQMSMMAQMSMMGVMDANCLNRTSHGCHAPSTLPSVLHPAVFLPMTGAWGGSRDRLPQPGGVLPDPLSAAFLACQTQPYNLDAYNRMAALYQQTLQQSTGAAPPISKT